MVADDFAQLVKAQADIVKIVGEHVRLRKAGAQNWSGLCPFHSEKSGSFSVHAARQFYHCFGCGVSGDVFTFIQKIENVSFPESVKIVAAKMGIALPKREFASPAEAAEHRERGRLIELHEQASAWFEEQLRSPEGAGAREYLAGRGLSTEGMEKFRIGYAPDSSAGLRQHLEKLAGAEAVRSGDLGRQLRLAGLFVSKEQEDGTQGPLYPRFRKRITFPIANEGGRVIAFTARALDPNEKAKYLNSPETPLYSKGQVLFNLDKARQGIRQLNFALLVEGQMDCISVSLAGIANVLATSGTAFTEAQVRLLGRYTKRVIVNFDPDTAGANAAEKSIALLTEEGFEVRVVTLEGGLDPDRFVRERGVAAYTAAVRGARRHSEYLLDRARGLYPATAQGKIDALNYLLPHIRRMPEPVTRADFRRAIAAALQIDGTVMEEQIKAIPGERGPLRVENVSKQAGWEHEQFRKLTHSAHPVLHEVYLDAFKARAIQKPNLAASMSAGTFSSAEKELIRALACPVGSAEFEAVAQALREYSERFAGLAGEPAMRLLMARSAGVDALDGLPEGPERRVVAEVLLQESGKELEYGEVEAALRSLECSALEREGRAVRVALAEAERSGDEARILELLVQKQQVERAIRGL